MSLDVSLSVEIDRQLPDAESDSTEKTLRGGRYGEAYVLPLAPTLHWVADEGTYQIVTTPVPGTGVAFAVNASVSETAGNFLYFKNNDVIGNSRNKRVYLHYIRLITTLPNRKTYSSFTTGIAERITPRQRRRAAGLGATVVTAPTNS